MPTRDYQSMKQKKKYHFLKMTRQCGINVYYRQEEKDLNGIETSLCLMYPNAKFEYGLEEL